MSAIDRVSSECHAQIFSAIDVSDQRGREHRVSLPSRAETFAEDFNETNVVAPTGPARTYIIQVRDFIAR